MNQVKWLTYIPVIGNFILMILAYLFLDWSIYFLFLFYLFDVLFFDFFQWRKNRKINQILDNINPPSILFNLFKALFFTCILELFFLNFLLEASFLGQTFYNEFLSFWTYTELGVQQGYVLLPILFLGSYLRIRQDLMKGIGIKRVVSKRIIKKTFYSFNMLRALILILLFSFSFLPQSISAYLWITSFSLLSAIKILFWRQLEGVN